MLGEAEGGRIVPGQEVFGVEEQAAHVDQGAVDPGVRTNCFARGQVGGEDPRHEGGLAQHCLVLKESLSSVGRFVFSVFESLSVKTE